MDYVRVSDDPLAFERQGLGPNLILQLFTVGGTLAAVGAMLAYPSAEQRPGDAGALVFSLAIVAGTIALVGVLLAAQRIAQQDRIIGQPGRVSLESGAMGPEVRVDRRTFAASDLQRVEVHRIPLHEGPDRFMLALVFRFGLVELSWTEHSEALEAGQQVCAKLGLPPVVERARPMIRGYAVALFGVIMLGILGMIAPILGMLFLEPTHALQTLPLIGGLFGVLGLTYVLNRAIGRKTTRDYLATEYELVL